MKIAGSDRMQAYTGPFVKEAFYTVFNWRVNEVVFCIPYFTLEE